MSKHTEYGGLTRVDLIPIGGKVRYTGAVEQAAILRHRLPVTLPSGKRGYVLLLERLGLPNVEDAFVVEACEENVMLVTVGELTKKSLFTEEK